MVYNSKQKLQKKSIIISDRTCKFLVIVESPSKIKAIGNYLGKNYQVIATNGHICNIKGLKDIDMKTFDVNYSIVESNKKTIDSMRSVIELYEKGNVFIATDGDVEGEKIGYDICQMFGLHKRIIFNEITEMVIKEAVLNPRLIDMNIIKSQQARQIVDILIGYKISPLLSKYISPLLSCGRCQSIALRLIYEKEKERVKDKGPKKMYEIVGSFFNYPHTLSFDLSHKFEKISEVRLFMEDSKTFEHEFNISEKYLSSDIAPSPFNTSKLLQKSSFSPKVTMLLAQQLYSDGMITYIRTESTKYSQDFIDKANVFILDRFKDNRYIGTLKNHTKDPHEAIRVTDINKISIEGDKNLVTLYNMIYRNSIESCMSTANYDNYDITVTSPLKDEYYKKTIRNPTFLGWKSYAKVSDKSYEISFFKYLKKNIKYQYIESTLVTSNQKLYYTQCLLLKKMEELSIGRPSTIVSYGEIILERGYVKLMNLDGMKEKCINLKLSNNEILEKEVEKQFGTEKNVYVIQETGIQSIEFLLKYFEDIFNYSYTKKIEEQLDLIKKDSSSWSEICFQTYKDIKSLITGIKIEFKDKKKIDENHEVVITNQGPMIKHKLDEKGSEYLPIVSGIDLDKLYNKEYSIKDVVQFENSLLGYYQEKPLQLKVGKFGAFFSWNEKNICIKDINIELKDSTIEKAISFIENGSINSRKKMDHKSKTILRVIDMNTSIRSGYYGDYIYHKTTSMKKPKFISLKNRKEDFLTCDASLIYKFI
jgi:DNA topoisomerase-1